MKVRFFRSPDGDETGTETEVKTGNETTDPTGLEPTEACWMSRDGGKAIDSDPVHDVPYDFCIRILNNGSKNSGKFKVKFTVGGDLSAEVETEEYEGLAPGATVLAVAHYGSFENKFGIYSLQSTVVAIDGREIIADAGFNFTINTD